jgi:hypothetical protein
MIWRLTYCNKKGVEARIDIIKGDRTSVEVVQGSANPFTLSYKLDKNDKSGHIMTSSADIEFFETETFNIDDLKTSNETELKVEYFEGNVLTWSGFILPDFFSKEIGSPNIIRMTASDRLSALKGVTLSDLPIRVSLRDLIELCLEQTGLSLALVAQIQINQGSTNILDSEILSQRLTDTRGRSISCYDILMSIMVATNSTMRQREGQWVVYNKLEHELRAPTIFFDKVERGAIRTIQPVASSVGVYNEFGGGRSYPENYDFSNFGLIPEFNFPDWTKVGAFNVSRGTKEIIGYSVDGQMQFGANTVDNYFFNSNVFNTSNYLQMDSVPIPYTSGQIEVSLDLNATAQTVSQFQTNVTAVKIAMGAVKDGSPTLWLNNNGIFAENNVVVHDLNFERGSVLEAQTKGFNLKGIINNPEGYSIIMRIYGSRDEGEDNRRQTAVHFAKIEFKSTQDAPKGNLYKTTQGSNFTKIHDIETTIFGDFIRNGLNGYFYEYPFDDTSNLYLPSGELSFPSWITAFDTTERPLLHHISRQKSRLFSVAHDILRANINVESFDPLAVFQDCKGGKYVVVSASFDFLRSEVDVELEQIAYDNTILKRDFIYSYFGEGESNIKSIGGITGGGSGTGGGGGMTSEQLEMLTNLASWWKLDEENDAIYSEKSVYSLKEVSAYGLGSGGGGGGLIETVYGYGNLGGTFSNADLNNTFNAYTINQLHLRIETLESGGGSGSVTSVALSAPTGFTVSGSPVTSSGTLNLAFTAGYSLPTTAKQTAWDNHLTATNNPHGVTAAQINGLSVSPTEGALGLRSLSLGGFGLKWTPQPTSLEAIKTGLGFGWHNTEWVIGNIRGGSTNSHGFGIGYVQGDGTLGGEFRIAVGGLAYLNNVRIATINSNVASATKLQTARTLWGQSFDGTGNVSGALSGATTITASTSITAPKVIFSAAGWSMVQTGTELQMQYNGVAKMRFLNGGSIVAVQEITAYS